MTQSEPHPWLAPEEKSSPSAPHVRLVIAGNADVLLNWLLAKLDEVRPAGRRRGPKGLKPQAIRKIRERIAQGESKEQVAADFGLATASIDNITKRKTHHDIE